MLTITYLQITPGLTNFDRVFVILDYILLSIFSLIVAAHMIFILILCVANNLLNLQILRQHHKRLAKNYRFYSNKRIVLDVFKIQKIFMITYQIFTKQSNYLNLFYSFGILTQLFSGAFILLFLILNFDLIPNSFKLALSSICFAQFSLSIFISKTMIFFTNRLYQPRMTIFSCNLLLANRKRSHLNIFQQFKIHHFIEVLFTKKKFRFNLFTIGSITDRSFLTFLIVYSCFLMFLYPLVRPNFRGSPF